MARSLSFWFFLSQRLGTKIWLTALSCYLALSCSVLLAQKEGSGGTPWPPAGLPPSVDLNSNGIRSLLNGGIPGVPNFTPFTKIEFSPVVPSQDQCSIGIDLSGQMEGLLLRDPRSIRLIAAAAGDPVPMLIFGPTDDCSLGILPGISGLSELDPVGLRLLGDFDGQTTTQGCRLLFGPTDLCAIEVDPIIMDGLRLKDPTAIRICSPFGPNFPPPPLRFGPTDDCSIGILPGIAGLSELDPVGFRLLGDFDGQSTTQGCRLLFGPTDLCAIEVDPIIMDGLRLKDPTAIRICNPDPAFPPPLLRFGPTDDCSIGIVPNVSGLSELDPVGLRLLGDFDGQTTTQGCRLLFGPTDLCAIEVDPITMDGLRLKDPNGIRLCNPIPGSPFPPPLWFGPDNVCGISVGGGQFGGMLFRDIMPFEFQNIVFAPQFVELSSKRWKTNIASIADPLEKIQKLRGVSFDWDQAHGGKPALGLIAEEVAEVIPEVVAYSKDEKEISGVNYSSLVGLLVEGIKQQQQQIDAQQQTVNELEAENVALNQKLADCKIQSERTDRLEDEVQLLREQLETIVVSQLANQQ